VIEEKNSLVAGEPVLVHGRLIIPIVRIQRFYGGCSFAASANPVAVLIVDGKEVFIASIDAEMDEDRLNTFLAETFGIISTNEND
jgi:uncharacterized spore protein YtfJ